MMVNAFGGGSLCGDKVVRFAYLDESGIGDAKKEPYVVVAGVIVDMDRQCKALEAHLHELADTYVPADRREGVVFHATEIFQGNKQFPRDVYSRETRHELLLRICEIPQKFGLPVVMGVVGRESVKLENPNYSGQELIAHTQGLASFFCVLATEYFIRTFGDPNEVAMLVYENNDNAREVVRATHNFMRDPNNEEALQQQFSDFKYAHLLPLQKIAESPLFSEKSDSSLLQIADAIAFCTNRKLRNAPYAQGFFDAFKNKLVVHPKAFWPYGE